MEIVGFICIISTKIQINSLITFINNKSRYLYFSWTDFFNISLATISGVIVEYTPTHLNEQDEVLRIDWSIEIMVKW